MYVIRRTQSELPIEATPLPQSSFSAELRSRRARILSFCLAVLLNISILNAADNVDPRITPLVRAVQHCQESIVNIHTEKNSVPEGESRFFTPRSRRVTGMGTGIVVDERGYIVTNYHVIQNVDQITVTLKDGSVLDARPVSFDRKHDMAVIRVTSPTPLTVMEMGISSEVLLAEQVFAIGNAFGYEHTVTAGIVSALGRDVEVDETQSYENLIQTDASINPGNSGGPLLNVLGEVIGINVAIRAGAQRIGFAIPIDDARRTVARLLSTERLNGISHGVFSTDTQSGSRKQLIVDEVAPGSAAELCGLKKGDHVTDVRGIRIQDGADLERSLLDVPVGDILDMKVMRDGQSVTLSFTVGVGSKARTAVASQSTPPVHTVSTEATTKLSAVRERTLAVLGLHLAAIDARQRRLIGSRYNGGMVVVGVRKESKAEKHGVRAGDVLLGLDGFETLNDRNLQFILQESRISKLESLSFQVFRQGEGALVGHLDLEK